MSRLLGSVAANADPASVIGMLLFHVEGSLLNLSLISPASQKLLRTVEALEARQVGLTDGRDAMALRLWLRRNAEFVNRFRADVHQQSRPDKDLNGANAQTDPDSRTEDLD